MSNQQYRGFYGYLQEPLKKGEAISYIDIHPADMRLVDNIWRRSAVLRIAQDYTQKLVNQAHVYHSLIKVAASGSEEKMKEYGDDPKASEILNHWLKWGMDVLEMVNLYGFAPWIIDECTLESSGSIVEVPRVISFEFGFPKVCLTRNFEKKLHWKYRASTLDNSLSGDDKQQRPRVYFAVLHMPMVDSGYYKTSLPTEIPGQGQYARLTTPITTLQTFYENVMLRFSTDRAYAERSISDPYFVESVSKMSEDGDGLDFTSIMTGAPPSSGQSSANKSLQPHEAIAVAEQIKMGRAATEASTPTSLLDPNTGKSMRPGTNVIKLPVNRKVVVPPVQAPFQNTVGTWKEFEKEVADLVMYPCPVSTRSELRGKDRHGKSSQQHKTDLESDSQLTSNYPVQFQEMIYEVNVKTFSVYYFLEHWLSTGWNYIYADYMKRSIAEAREEDEKGAVNQEAFDAEMNDMLLHAEYTKYGGDGAAASDTGGRSDDTSNPEESGKNYVQRVYPKFNFVAPLILPLDNLIAFHKVGVVERPMILAALAARLNVDPERLSQLNEYFEELFPNVAERMDDFLNAAETGNAETDGTTRKQYERDRSRSDFYTSDRGRKRTAAPAVPENRPTKRTKR